MKKAIIFKLDLPPEGNTTTVRVNIENKINNFTIIEEELELPITGRFSNFDNYLQYAVEQLLLDNGYDLSTIPKPEGERSNPPPHNLIIPKPVSI